MTPTQTRSALLVKQENAQTASLRPGQHRCPTCGAVDAANTGHCVGGKYGGCCRSYSADSAFARSHQRRDDGHLDCLDPAETGLVARPARDGHDVWGWPGPAPEELAVMRQHWAEQEAR